MRTSLALLASVLLTCSTALAQLGANDNGGYFDQDAAICIEGDSAPCAPYISAAGECYTRASNDEQDGIACVCGADSGFRTAFQACGQCVKGLADAAQSQALIDSFTQEFSSYCGTTITIDDVASSSLSSTPSSASASTTSSTESSASSSTSSASSSSTSAGSSASSASSSSTGATSNTTSAPSSSSSASTADDRTATTDVAGATPTSGASGRGLGLGAIVVVGISALALVA